MVRFINNQHSSEDMYVPRAIEPYFQKLQQSYALIAVVGARQAGKTTLLKEQIKGKNAVYLLFDDPDVRTLFEEDIKKFEHQYLEEVEISVLDEVQYCKDAGIKLKYLFEQGRRIWVTSSSEVLLGKEIVSYLVGRVSLVKVYPFSFFEFLCAKGIQETTAATRKRAVWEHALYGGYPKVVLTADIGLKKIILRDLYETMILKDIAKTFSIGDIRALEECTRYLAFNIGAILSYDSMAKTLKISFPTIKKYLGAMEKSYLITRIVPFYRNQNKELSKQPKLYFIDTGLRNSILVSFTVEPEGKLFENYLLTELIKAGFIPKYWRTKGKAEVDFVIEKDNEIIPIEVKLKAEDQVELSLRSFIEIYRPERAFIIFYTGDKQEKKIGACTVSFTDTAGLLEKLNR